MSLIKRGKKPSREVLQKAIQKLLNERERPIPEDSLLGQMMAYQVPAEEVSAAMEGQEKSGGDGKPWDGIVSASLPKMVNYVNTDGVSIMEIPMSIRIKGFGKYAVAVRMERHPNGEYVFYSLFTDVDGKFFRYSYIDGAIDSISTIVSRVFKEKKISQKNKELFLLAVKERKIVRVK